MSIATRRASLEAREAGFLVQYNATYSEFEFAKLGPNFLEKV